MTILAYITLGLVATMIFLGLFVNERLPKKLHGIVVVLAVTLLALLFFWAAQGCAHGDCNDLDPYDYAAGDLDE